MVPLVWCFISFSHLSISSLSVPLFVPFLFFYLSFLFCSLCLSLPPSLSLSDFVSVLVLFPFLPPLPAALSGLGSRVSGLS